MIYGNRRQEKGTTLIAAMLTAAVMMGFTVLYFTATHDGLRDVSRHVTRDRILYLAESGIGEGIDHLNRGGGEALLDRSDDAVWTYWVTVADRGLGAFGQEIFQVSSTAEIGARTRTVDGVVENLLRTPPLVGAVQARGACVLTGGTTTVDGRDHDSFGLGVVGPGVDGFVCGGAATLLGGALVGGNGIAPFPGAGPEDGVFRANLTFGDTADDDGDGIADEEILDGADNDGDGLVDEDLAPYVTSPDRLFNLPEGTIRRFCERRGTLFESQEDLKAYLLGLLGEFPQGEVVYLEDDWDGASFGAAMNVQPSILVVHEQDGSAALRNLSGQFKGLVIADNVAHASGTIQILGAVYALGDASFGNALGVSSSVVRYSSLVLEELPEIPYYSLRAWRDVPGAPASPPVVEKGLEAEPGGGFQ